MTDTATDTTVAEKVAVERWVVIRICEDGSVKAFGTPKGIFISSNKAAERWRKRIERVSRDITYVCEILPMASDVPTSDPVVKAGKVVADETFSADFGATAPSEASAVATA